MGFLHRDAAASEFMPFGEEPFAGVAFAEELFMLGAELVPERVERFVVGAMNDVTKPVRRNLNKRALLCLEHYGKGGFLTRAA